MKTRIIICVSNRPDLLEKQIQTIEIDVDADAEPPPAGGDDEGDEGYSGPS